MRQKSDVGSVIEQTRPDRTDKETPSSYMHGWKPGPGDMPSMQDFNRVYGQADLLEGREMLFVGEVASHIDGYRSTISFEHECTKRFGIVFFSEFGSFFVVFGYEGMRTAKLFYMGVESDQVLHCCKLASRFEMDFEDAYFDLRDQIIGKFGIPRSS